MNLLRTPRYSAAVTLLASLLTGSVLLTTCSKTSSTSLAVRQPGNLPHDALATCTVSQAEFNTWFADGRVTLDGVVNPANSVTFPSNVNCDFYKWSEQMFLWLTSPAPAQYGGTGRIFDSPVFYDVSPAINGERVFLPHVPGQLRRLNTRVAQVGPHHLPVVIDKTGRLLEVETPSVSRNGKPRILNEKGDSIEIERIAVGADRKPVFFDRDGRVILNGKPIIRRLATGARSTLVQKFMVDNSPIFVDSAGNIIDVEQGQADNGVLRARNGSLVYYATMANDVYAYFLTAARNGSINPTPTQFPVSQTDLDKIIAFAEAHGKTLPDSIALAIELKTSWIEAAGLPDLNTYITMEATIPTYDTTNANAWIPTGQKQALLAMVGMHVVGSVNHHPEMVWSTFEHINNAPVASYTYINNSNTTVTVPRNTAGNWVFCENGSTGPFNALHMKYNPTAQSIQAQPGYTISASNSLRWKTWGSSYNTTPNQQDTSVAASNTELIAINSNIGSMLANGDIRANYIMTGSTWTLGGAAPSGSYPGGNEIGTSKLSNVTMETYQQGGDSLLTGLNCFDCHNGGSPPNYTPTNTTNVSHVFPQLLPLFPANSQ